VLQNVTACNMVWIALGRGWNPFFVTVLQRCDARDGEEKEERCDKWEMEIGRESGEERVVKGDSF